MPLICLLSLYRRATSVLSRESARPEATARLWLTAIRC